MEIKVYLPLDYPKLWQSLNSKLPLSMKWNSNNFRLYLKARYNLDVATYPEDLSGTIYVDEQDWTLFLLKVNDDRQG